MVTLNLVMHLVSQFTQSQITADSDTHISVLPVGTHHHLAAA